MADKAAIISYTWLKKQQRSLNMADKEAITIYTRMTKQK
jgi:hypothetical protein